MTVFWILGLVFDFIPRFSHLHRSYLLGHLDGRPLPLVGLCTQQQVHLEQGVTEL